MQEDPFIFCLSTRESTLAELSEGWYKRRWNTWTFVEKSQRISGARRIVSKMIPEASLAAPWFHVMGQEFWDPASRDAGDAQEKKVRPDLDATIARMVFFCWQNDALESAYTTSIWCCWHICDINTMWVFFNLQHKLTRIYYLSYFYNRYLYIYIYTIIYYMT